MIQARAVARRQGHSLGLAKSLPRRARPTRCEGRRVRGGWRAYGCGKQGGDDEREAGRMDFAAGEMANATVVRSEESLPPGCTKPENIHVLNWC